VSTAEPAHPLGAHPDGEGGCHFTVWAPLHDELALVLGGPGDLPRRTVRMERDPQNAERGYFCAHVREAPVGTRYLYRLSSGQERPDPASRSQPDGVHGASEVVLHEPRVATTGWRGRRLRDYVLYELHVGTFTAARTFDAAAARLADLVQLGVTAVELLPVFEFPGARGWGYDVAYPYAVHGAYRGRAGLVRFVQHCHAHGLAVVLDVVYNHLGPEGSYLAEYAPYFTDRYRTPWGQAFNFDGAGSDEVRRYVIDNAVEWIEALGVDGLRLDAVHAIVDPSARPVLAELSEAVHRAGRRLGREVVVIAESDANDRRLIEPRGGGGMGMDAVWADDLHHGLHAWLTGERDGYYEDFGAPEQLAACYRKGWCFTGQRSRYRQRRHGNDPSGLPAERFVVCTQNHDQVGNRARGERLTGLLDAARVRLALAAVLLSPFTPLLFMGEEYGERRPFPYFVSHLDPDLLEAVRQGRAREFAAFASGGDIPDPGAVETFEAARLDPAQPGAEPRRTLVAALLALRAETLATLGDDPPRASELLGESGLLVVLGGSGAALGLILYAGDGDAVCPPFPAGHWELALSTDEERFGGSGRGGLPASIEGGDPAFFTPPGPLCAAYRRQAPGSQVIT
jgi:maltooligosyltrehalose trehalohydrolase